MQFSTCKSRYAGHLLCSPARPTRNRDARLVAQNASHTCAAVTYMRLSCGGRISIWNVGTAILAVSSPATRSLCTAFRSLGITSRGQHFNSSHLANDHLDFRGILVAPFPWITPSITSNDPVRPRCPPHMNHASAVLLLLQPRSRRSTLRTATWSPPIISCLSLLGCSSIWSHTVSVDQICS